MRNNERMIQRMSLEDKIRFILCGKLYGSSEVKGYNFPSFYLKDDGSTKGDGPTTIFPSQKALADAWNVELQEKITTLNYEEQYVASKEFTYRKNFDFANSFSEDPFLLSSYALASVEGVRKTSSLLFIDQPIFVSNKKEKEFKMLPYEELLKDQKFDYVIVHSIHEMKYYRETKKYTKTIFGHSCNPDEIARMLFLGATLVYVDQSYEENVSSLIKKNEEYDNALAQYHNHQIDSNEFDRLNRRGLIISNEVIDDAVDKLLDLLTKINDLKNGDITSTFVKETNNQLFAYKDHADIALKAAQEAIILLKNDNDILPLNHNKKIAFIGNPIEDNSYFENTFNGKPTSCQSTLSLIDSYTEFNSVGYAHGYLKDKESMELIGASKNLAEKADIAVVYLWGDGKRKLQDEQIKLIDELADIKCNIVAVVISPIPVDLPFVDKCKAILFTRPSGQECTRAILDVLSGKVSPSGRLSETYRKSQLEEEIFDNVPRYLKRNEEVLFPFGFGLSYSKFKYSNLEVNMKGVEFTVTNEGNCDSFEVPQLYISHKNKENIYPLTDASLKGFKKVFLRKNEAAKVFIPFTISSFRYYDENKKTYGTKGGEYNLLICTNCRSVVLSAITKVSQYYENRPLDKGEITLESEFSSSVIDDFVNESKPKPKPINFMKNVIISSVIGVYFIVASIIMMAYATGDAVYFGSNPTPSILLGVLIILATLGSCGLFDYFSYQKSKVQIPRETNETLTTLIDDVPEYVVTQRKVYDVVENLEEKGEFETFEALPEEVKEEIKEEVPQEEEEEEAQEIIVVDDSINEKASEVIKDDILTDEEIESLSKIEVKEEDLVDEQYDEEDSLDKNIVFDDTSSFTQLCSSFISFAQGKGLQVDYGTVRSIFACLASTHIIVLKNNIKEDTILLMNILNEFLDNIGDVYRVKDDAKTLFDICFEQNEDGKYDKTSFVENIFYSTRMKNNVNLVMLDNVNMKYAPLMLKDFISYSLNPSKDHIVSFSKRLRMKLPSNLIIVISPTNNNYLDMITNDFAEASIAIDLSIRKIEPMQDNYEKEKTLSYSYLIDLVKESKKANYLSEDEWKKLDELEEELFKTIKYKFNNKTTLELERYSSVYIDCDGEPIDALSSYIANKIVPILKTLSLGKEENAKEKIYAMLEKYFKEEYLLLAKKVLQISSEIN
ncbi:MAG: glycoside hydrolase family 3 C-terminal domain-containing protein [Bacilli bacterium]